jgi:hypothetical protein
VPADTAGTTTSLYDREPLRDDATHLKRARISYPLDAPTDDVPAPPYPTRAHRLLLAPLPPRWTPCQVP